jgi:hypothetical protein
MRSLLSKSSKKEAPGVALKQPLPARIAAARGMVDYYGDTLNSLRPYWLLVLPFLFWYARRAYERELLQLREEQAKEQARFDAEVERRARRLARG